MDREEAITHIDAMINTMIIVKGFVPDEYDIEALRMAIESLSADRPSGEWIPIEERKPDTADHVMVTAKWDDLDYEVFELDYGVTKALANRQGYMHQDYCKNLIEHIIAWQYKPEPYIKDGETE